VEKACQDINSLYTKISLKGPRKFDGWKMNIKCNVDLMFHELMDFMLCPSQIGGHCMKYIKPWIQKVVFGLEENFNNFFVCC
jgi:hypothetical protein